MAEKHDLGNKGEEIAVEHLRSLGYTIRHTNWRVQHLELDIVAMDDNELVVAEVKTRGSNSYEHPSEAVSNKKIRFLVNATEAYIQEYDLDVETRFDVISIIFFSKTDFELEHFKDAFYPPIN